MNEGKGYQFRQFYMRGGIRAALDRYAREHVPVGDFLTCCLQNDLHGALSRADDDNMHNIPAVVAYLYNEMPGTCWGSKEKVDAWIAARPKPAEDSTTTNKET